MLEFNSQRSFVVTNKLLATMLMLNTNEQMRKMYLYTQLSEEIYCQASWYRFFVKVIVP